MSRYEGPLGMIPPSDDNHRRRYGLTAETTAPIPMPAVAGWAWYSAFDSPFEDANGKFWLVPPSALPASRQSWGRIRGGHCICLNSPHLRDYPRWHGHYDQKINGPCVGFGVSRALSLVNRVTFDGMALFDDAQLIDEWSDTPPRANGTSVRAGLDVARHAGPYLSRAGKTTGPIAKYGILENRWIASPEDLARALSPHDGGLIILNRGWVELKQSWGWHWPFSVRAELETINRLTWYEDGEISTFTDLPR
jgi:hypothetical protein